MLALREHSRAELERKLLHKLRQRRASEARHEPDGDGGPSDGWSESPSEAGSGAGEAADAVTDDDDRTRVDERLRAEIDKALDELQSQGLLSDQRAADALLLAKAPRYGSRRLKQLMQSRSFDSELVSQTLGRARGSEFDRAWALWQRRFGAPPADLRERARQQRFLAARGFESAVIAQVLKQAGDATAAAPDD